MYSKQEASQLRQEFWTTFGQYLSPILSAEGEKINWINYKTGEKNISFRMHADNRKAIISVELTHKDGEIQQIYFEQFVQFKNLFDDAMNEEWNWQLHTYDEHGKLISKIFKEKTDVSIFQKGNWPELISFFKPRIIALDEFWSQVKYSFEMLR
ncbi:MAG: DUF4268 domain-containing protein [Flavisolibacter sp.]|nr:DUF4268 domain-containing protein [Flavisolibacter sp.]